MNELLWFVSRATGTVTVVLLTVVLVLGLVTSGRRTHRSDHATVLMALHRSLSLGAVAFLGVHVATAVAETYVDIDAYAAVVPFVSGYEPLAVGLGALGVDAFCAVVVTSLLRHRLSSRTWVLVHRLAHVLWPTAVVHGFLLGTDDEPVLRGVTVACGVVVLVVAGWRLRATHADRARRAEVLAQEWT